MIVRKLLMTLLLVLPISMSWAADQHLADRHGARGTQCVSCHGNGKPSANVSNDRCLACHGSYAQLAEKTAKLDVNPHASHLGDMPCVRCHQGHKPSVLICNNCHQFKMAVP